MTTWRDVSLGAGRIDGGLQMLGVRGKVHVAFEDPSDGERLEVAFSKQARLEDMTLPDGTLLRTCILNGVKFRWEKR